MDVREVEGDLEVREVKSKVVVEDFLKLWHYLSKQGSGIRSCINYGLYYKEELIGVIVFHTISAWETMWGCFGKQISKGEQDGFWELGRLAIDGRYNEEGTRIKNLTSWFVCKAIKKLRMELRERNKRERDEYLRNGGEVGDLFYESMRHRGELRVLLSYADDLYHKGYIYQASGFKYYGMSKEKNDFWYYAECEEVGAKEMLAYETSLLGIKEDERREILDRVRYRVTKEYIDELGRPIWRKLSRGKTTPMYKLGKGEWRPRSRKHRYMIIYDKKLRPLWEEENYPKGSNEGGLDVE